MKYFVNLPITWLHQDLSLLDLFADKKLNPELGFDDKSLELPLTRHQELSRMIHEAGLECAVHLPFLGLAPGSPVEEKREISAATIIKGAVIAGYYNASHMIGHTAFNPETDAAHATDKQIKYSVPVSEKFSTAPSPSARWIEYSIATWSKVLKNHHAPLHLENTYDRSPKAQLAIIGSLSELGESAGFCLDIGHWFSFAQGIQSDNLADWITAIAQHLTHMHIHDNDGSGDQHLAPGDGKIPFAELFSLLRQNKVFPNFTLEPHEITALEHSLLWLQKDKNLHAWLEEGNTAYSKKL